MSQLELSCDDRRGFAGRFQSAFVDTINVPTRQDAKEELLIVNPFCFQVTRFNRPVRWVDGSWTPAGRLYGRVFDQNRSVKCGYGRLDG